MTSTENAVTAGHSLLPVGSGAGTGCQRPQLQGGCEVGPTVVWCSVSQSRGLCGPSAHRLTLLGSVAPKAFPGAHAFYQPTH